jgi:hypothetical protein
VRNYVLICNVWGTTFLFLICEELRFNL